MVIFIKQPRKAHLLWDQHNFSRPQNIYDVLNTVQQHNYHADIECWNNLRMLPADLSCHHDQSDGIMMWQGDTGTSGDTGTYTHPDGVDSPANTRRLPNAGTKLSHCRRRWPNIQPTLCKRLVSHHTFQPHLVMLCKAERQYLFTCKVSRYRLWLTTVD